MFLAHYAIGLAGKRFAPRVSLGTLILAAQFADLLWPAFVLTGVEVVRVVPGITAITPLDFVSYPYSHSGLAILGWAAAVGACVFAVYRRLWESTVVGVIVCSHWVLDLLAHRPDLPLMPFSSRRYGLGLWQSPPATLAVESALLAVAIATYAMSTRARDRAGRVGLVALVVCLVAAYAGAIFGPPPPSPRAVAWSAQSLWLFVAWGYWLDRHRPTRTPRLPTESADHLASRHHPSTNEALDPKHPLRGVL